MNTKTVYLFNEETRKYSGKYEAQESPLVPGSFIEPFSSTSIEVVVAEGQEATFTGDEWIISDIPKPDPTPAPSVESVPQVVSVFQGRAALMQAGYLDDVEQYMATADPFEKLAWDTVTEMRRASPITIKLAVLLGLTDSQVDDLFVFAATISA